MPVTIWITSTSSASEPKMYQKLKFFGRVLRHVNLVGVEAVGNRFSNQLVTFAPSPGVRRDFLEFVGHGFFSLNLLVFTDQGLGVDRYMCGAPAVVRRGLFLNTRPAMSNVDPWQGRKPPPQSLGSDGWGRGELVGRRAAQVRADAHGTRNLGLMERHSFCAYSA